MVIRPLVLRCPSSFFGVILSPLLPDLLTFFREKLTQEWARISHATERQVSLVISRTMPDF